MKLLNGQQRIQPAKNEENLALPEIALVVLVSFYVSCMCTICMV